jgi:MFS family permease
VLASVLVLAAVVSVLGGRVIDRVGKLRAVIPAVASVVVGLIGMFFARGMLMVILVGTVMMGGFMLSTAAPSANVRDQTPVDRVGMVQGLRMVFVVLIPLVVGPLMAALVIIGANETYVDLGVIKQVPTPGMFIAAVVIAVLVVIPVLPVRCEPVALEASAVVDA